MSTETAGPATTASSRRVWLLPASTASCGAARRQVTSQLNTWRLSHAADDVVLIVSELVGNAVVRGSGPVRVALSVESREHAHHVRVEVRDRGVGSRQNSASRTTSTGGASGWSTACPCAGEPSSTHVARWSGLRSRLARTPQPRSEWGDLARRGNAAWLSQCL
ncbi:ATP-binding protein [Streptomyces sp. DSM 116496]|uniref:ATP-binding protein n=1 Tax=Streptomyces stoeckheimensis TaxID=3344656 RepID=UPI0038B36C5B